MSYLAAGTCGNLDWGIGRFYMFPSTVVLCLNYYTPLNGGHCVVFFVSFYYSEEVRTVRIRKYLRWIAVSSDHRDAGQARSVTVVVAGFFFFFLSECFCDWENRAFGRKSIYRKRFKRLILTPARCLYTALRYREVRSRKQPKRTKARTKTEKTKQVRIAFATDDARESV